MKTLEDVIIDIKETVCAWRHDIDDDKMKVLRIEADISRKEGAIAAVMDVVDALKESQSEEVNKA